jgi:hypothetical protein
MLARVETYRHGIHQVLTFATVHELLFLFLITELSATLQADDLLV